jgi:hypothetical protein
MSGPLVYFFTVVLSESGPQLLMHPVYPDFSRHYRDEMDDLVGFLVVVLPWDSYFTTFSAGCINAAWWSFST